jgi:hypothetical protein
MASAPRPDTAEIIRFLELMAEPGQVIELRLLNVRGTNGFLDTLSGYFSDHRKLAAEAAKHTSLAEGAYVTINPTNPVLLAPAANRLRKAGKSTPLTTDADITARHWLPIDLDPVRPRGISSTEEEHELALERARQIRDALYAENWPRPILGDSGKGGHLLYRIDLPADDNGIVQRCLEALALRFDDDGVKVDRAVFNPSRIWKLTERSAEKVIPCRTARTGWPEFWSYSELCAAPLLAGVSGTPAGRAKGQRRLGSVFGI